jgi:dolichyl-phosphate beta-glucosyltransferase
MSKISVVVPVYNESPYLCQFIGKQIKGLLKLGYPFELIISENGSSDDTKRLAKELYKKYPQIVLISTPLANYGNAVKRGFLKASGDYIVLFDLDYFDFPFLKKSLRLLEKYDVVVGSKNLKKSQDKRHFVRRLGSQSFSLILKVMFDYSLNDTHGIKVLKRKKVTPLIKQTLFTREIFDTELLIRAQKARLNLVEIPVQVKELRKSRSSIVRRTLKTIPDLIKLKMALTQELLKRS